MLEYLNTEVVLTYFQIYVAAFFGGMTAEIIYRLLDNYEEKKNKEKQIDE